MMITVMYLLLLDVSRLRARTVGEAPAEGVVRWNGDLRPGGYDILQQGDAGSPEEGTGAV